MPIGASFNDGDFLVYAREQLVGSELPWLLARYLEPVSWRCQERGLGSATLRIVNDLPRPGDESFLQDDESYVTPFSGWIMIVRRDRVPDPSTVPLEISDATDLPQPPEWWGFLRTTPVEQFVTPDITGTLEANEFGYFLLGDPIVHTTHHPGYNPSIDGTRYGNRPISEATADITEVSSWWTGLQVLQDLGLNTSIPIGVDSATTTAGAHPVLDAIETWPSYEGESMMTALSQIANPLGWYFSIYESASEVTARLYPRAVHEGLGDDDKKTLFVDLNTIEVHLTRHRRAYDRVILRGERTLVTFTASTFSTLEVPGGEATQPSLLPGWSADDQAAFVAGPPGAISNGEIGQAAVDQLGGFDPDVWEDENDYESTLNEEIQRFAEAEFDRNQLWRLRNYPNVYQRFVWALEENTGRLYVSRRPGVGETPSSALINPATEPLPATTPPTEKLIAFPRFQFQDTTTQEVLGWPVVEEDADAQPGPTDWTPGPHLTIPIEQDADPSREDLWHKPFYAFRSIGPVSKVEWPEGQRIRKLQWQDGTLQGPGRQTGTLRHDGFGIQLSLPYPEALAAPFRDLYVDLITDIGDGGGLVMFYEQAYNLNDQEWFGGGDPTSVAASLRNPVTEEYTDKGHWGRMIFTISVYTSQYAQLVKDLVPEPSSTKVIEDPELQLWCYVWGTVVNFRESAVISGTGLENESTRRSTVSCPNNSPQIVNDGSFGDYIITRNTVTTDAAQERLNLVADWYSKELISVEVHGPANQPEAAWENLRVGDLVVEIEDPVRGTTQEMPAGTAVSSIETILGDQPRRILTTDVPQAPVNARFRRLVD